MDQSINMPPSPIIIALDYPAAAPALALVERLSPELCQLKIGKELFTRAGPALVETLQYRGYRVFLDLKFHDIPNTVAGACRAAADLGVWMVDVHALGGRRMIETAAATLAQYQHPPLLLAVTVLTSLSPSDLTELGWPKDPAVLALHLAQSARAAGVAGLVCSAHEASALRHALGADLCLVTPGIRSPEAPADDQQRTMTPADAIQAGADYLVVGRPVTRAPDPLAALQMLVDACAAAKRPSDSTRP